MLLDQIRPEVLRRPRSALWSPDVLRDAPTVRRWWLYHRAAADGIERKRKRGRQVGIPATYRYHRWSPQFPGLKSRLPNGMHVLREAAATIRRATSIGDVASNLSRCRLVSRKANADWLSRTGKTTNCSPKPNTNMPRVQELTRHTPGAVISSSMDRRWPIAMAAAVRGITC